MWCRQWHWHQRMRPLRTSRIAPLALMRLLLAEHADDAAAGAGGSHCDASVVGCNDHCIEAGVDGLMSSITRARASTGLHHMRYTSYACIQSLSLHTKSVCLPSLAIDKFESIFVALSAYHCILRTYYTGMPGDHRAVWPASIFIRPFRPAPSPTSSPSSK